MKMRLGQFLMMAIAAVSLFVMLSGSAASQAMPHAVFGTVTDTEGAAVASASIVVENQRTGNTITTTTNGTGHYIVDLSSLSGGYQNGDIIIVRASRDELSGESSFTLSTSTIPYDECNVTIEESGGFDSIIILGVLGAAFIIIAVVGLFFMSRQQETAQQKKPSKRRRR